MKEEKIIQPKSFIVNIKPFIIYGCLTNGHLLKHNGKRVFQKSATNYLLYNPPRNIQEGQLMPDIPQEIDEDFALELWMESQ